MNYHVGGWSHDVVATNISKLGGKYYSLPSYSPELNPIELIWAYLKHELHNTELTSDLPSAVVKIMQKIDHEQVANCYEECGYSL